MSSALLIAKYLGAEKQAELIENLLVDIQKENTENDHNVEVLIELLDGFDLDKYPQFYNQILNFCNKKLLLENELEIILKFVYKIPQLKQDILERIIQLLYGYIKEQIYYFNQQLIKLIPISIVDNRQDSTIDSITSDELILLFQFLQSLFTTTTTTAGNDDTINLEIDYLLLLFLGINDKQISNVTSKLLRWRMNSISQKIEGQLIWDIIFTLESTNLEFHKSHAYILWLRYLNTGLIANDTFQTIIQKSDYWKSLQQGLISDSHEYRKFSLSILQVSLTSINTDLNNDYIVWEITDKQKYLNEWSRYMTLYEIIAIDTSLNQAEAGQNDITGLISPTSLIPSSWGWCLLSTGLQATLESVRKFTLRLLLSIPSENLYLIKHGLPILEKAFLPNLMNASNLNVKITSNDKLDCEYAYQLKNYICNMVKNLSTDQEFQDITLSILRVLADLKDSYGPSRILVLHGLYDGLNHQANRKQVLQYGIHDIPLLVLFEKKCEGEIYERYHQALNLRLLLNFKLDIKSFLSTLNKFIKHNGFELLKENHQLFTNYIQDVPIEKFMSHQELGDCGPEYKALFLGITDKDIGAVLEEESQEKDLLLAKLFASGLKTTELKKFNSRLQKLVLLDDMEIIQTLSQAEFELIGIPDNEDISKLWETIKNEIQSNEYRILEECLYKFRLFNQIYKNSTFQFENITTIIDFHRIMLNNSYETSKTSRFFYKLKDEILGEYYTTLNLTFEKTTTNTNASISISAILDVLNPGIVQNKANYNMVNLLYHYLEITETPESIYQIVEFLSELWFNLSATRLKLQALPLHLSIIKTFFHPKVVFSKVDKDEEEEEDIIISDMLHKFGISIIENSKVRRSFLPTLTLCLSNCQIQNQKQFESYQWIPELLIKAYLIYQPKAHFFILPIILADIYDKQVAINSNSNIYHQVYGDEEISARINLLAIFNSIKSSSFTQSVYDYIIDNQQYFHLFKPLKSTDALEEWTRMQLYSIILSLSDNLTNIDLDIFLARLATEPSPMVRSYIEWIIALKLSDNGNYVDKLLNELFQKINILKPSVVTSYLKILFLFIQQQSTTKECQLLTKLLYTVIPGCTVSRKMIRHFSLSLIISIHDEIKRKNLPLDPRVLDIVNNMYLNAIESETFAQYRSGDELLWDIVKDLTLVNISGGVMLRLSDRTDLDFIKKENFDKYLSQDQINLLKYDIGQDPQLWMINEEKEEEEEEDYDKKRKLNLKKPIVTPIKPVDSNEVLSSSFLQTKSGAWNTIMDADAVVDDVNNTNNSVRGSEIPRSELIVVSSLVDKPPNLGGICRLCDVLGAGLLTLHDIEVKNHINFKTVAVTADQWMPMIEVKMENIKQYLLDKKREGYTLIGLEQTDKSIELNNDLKFPKKSLILIGKEREGIPGDLLAELDFCVEIKQVGIVRSMNIQTATAIIVHAYSSQHC